MQPDLLNSLPVAKVRPAEDVGPRRFETGTPNFEGIAAVEAATSDLIALSTYIHANPEPALQEHKASAVCADFLERFEAAGFPRESVDVVLCTHLHFDHAGGLLPRYEEIQAGNDRLLFPKARYLVGKEAFARALFAPPKPNAALRRAFARGRKLIRT